MAADNHLREPCGPRHRRPEFCRIRCLHPWIILLLLVFILCPLVHPASAAAWTAEQDAAEDAIVDCSEVLAKAPRAPATEPAVDRARTAVILSERLRADEVFARQLRRKLKLG